jgi:hypothetical protein
MERPIKIKSPKDLYLQPDKQEKIIVVWSNARLDEFDYTPAGI